MISSQESIPTAISPPAVIGSQLTAPLRIACWPLDANNPYQRLFYEALEGHNIHTVFPHEIGDDWLLAHADDIDVLHLHWPESLWRTRGRSRVGHLRGVVGVHRMLKLAHRLGIRVVWTVHNFEHHDGASWVDRLGTRTLARGADLLICHDEDVVERIQRSFRPAGEIVVMPHGNYDGCYPKPRDRAVVLEEFGLEPSRPTLCCVGQLRQYKGFDLAVEAIRRLDGRVQLLIAGNPHPEFDMEHLRSSSAGLPYVRLVEGYLSDQQFADAVCAGDGVVFPYRTITGSGALLAALTLGRSVIAADLPLFKSYSDRAPEAMTIFKTGSSTDLATAINRHFVTSVPQRNAAARRLAEHFAWHQVVEPIADLLTRFRTTSP